MEKMPLKIYATPRGSGTISGIYVDMLIGDEPRGEHKYIRADAVEKILEKVLPLLKAVPSYAPTATVVEITLSEIKY